MFKNILLSAAVAVVAGGFVSAPAWAADRGQKAPWEPGRVGV